jgi:hypothetical protein
MNAPETRQAIQTALAGFAAKPLADAATALFESLDYARQRQPATDELLESIKAGFSKNPALIDSH